MNYNNADKDVHKAQFHAQDERLETDYSLISFTEIEVVAIILECFTCHKDYGKRFKYE